MLTTNRKRVSRSDGWVTIQVETLDAVVSWMVHESDIHIAHDWIERLPNLDSIEKIRTRQELDQTAAEIEAEHAATWPELVTPILLVILFWLVLWCGYLAWVNW